MAVGDESIGYGATVTIDDAGTGAAAGAAATAISYVISLGVPSIVTGTAESKRLGNSRIRKIATIEDGGTFSIRQHFTNAGFDRMEANRSNKNRLTFVITVPDDNGNTEITVVGLITENKTDALEVDKITEFETMVTVAE